MKPLAIKQRTLGRLAQLELTQHRDFSTFLDRRSENAVVLAVTIAELELGDVRRHVFAT